MNLIVELTDEQRQKLLRLVDAEWHRLTATGPPREHSGKLDYELRELELLKRMLVLNVRALA